MGPTSAPDRAVLSQPEAVTLGHALVGEVARRAGIRVLAIKGPVLAAMNLRGEHPSVDVDVLVSPADRDDLVEALAQAGWAPRPLITSPMALPSHARTLRHPRWPVELDLHDRFPGIFVDPADGFEILWERRCDVRLAGVDVRACDAVATTIVAALHQLRDPRPHRDGALRDLAARFEEATGATPAQLVALADRLRCSDVLRPFLELLDPPMPLSLEPLTARELADWRLYTQHPPSTTGWLHALVTAPWRRWPAILRQAVLLSDAEIDHFHAIPADHGSRLRPRLRRLGRGLRDLPAAIAVLVRLRRVPRGRA